MRQRLSFVAVLLLGLPGLSRAEGQVPEPGQSFFNPGITTPDITWAGDSWGLNPWGSFWSTSDFQSNRFATKDVPTTTSSSQPPQTRVLPPLFVPPINPLNNPLLFPRPVIINNNGGGNRLPGQGSSSGGDDSPAGVLLHVNYANMFALPNQYQPRTTTIINPYPYGANPYGVNPYGLGANPFPFGLFR